MNKKCCLSEDFFHQLNSVYENCYRINPNPSDAFLERMLVIEIEARRLRDSLEELQFSSYRNWEPERLTEKERSMLNDYDRSALIIKEFMPYITAAFILSMPPPEIPDPFDYIGTLSSGDASQDITSLELIDLPRTNTVSTILEPLPPLFPQEVVPEVVPESKEPEVLPHISVDLPSPSPSPTDVGVLPLDNGSVRCAGLVEVESTPRGSEIEFEQLVRDTCLTWGDVQDCYPETSIVKFLQQVMASARIHFNMEYNPVLAVRSMKGTYQYEYELNEHAFKHDLDSILNERVVEELHTLVDDLEN